MDNLQGQGDGILGYGYDSGNGKEGKHGCKIQYKAQIVKFDLIWFKPSKGNYEAGSCICTQSSEEWSRNHCHVNGS